MVIGIVPNLFKDINGSATKKVLQYLENHKCEIVLEKSNESIFGGGYSYTDEIYCVSDVVIAIGGDATIIRAAKLASNYDKPVLGINNGTVGYMAAIELDELNLLDNLLSNDFSIEERMIIEAETSDGTVHYCLNDLVIKNASYSGLADIQLYNNDKHIVSYRADGVIISTPTGSTAYSLSAGGPITDPTVECMIITPICAHSVAARSVVLSANDKFCIKINNTDKNTENLNICVAFDGRDEGIKLKTVDEITFEKSDNRVARLVKIKNQSFYDILKNKLN